MLPSWKLVKRYRVETLLVGPSLSVVPFFNSHGDDKNLAGLWSCKRFPPGIHFSVNIGKFWLSYFRELATDFPESSQVKLITKFGTINRSWR